MLNCIITVGDQKFTSEEFVEFVLANGLGALKEGAPTTSLGEKILHKLDVPNLEDSLVETWTKLERKKQGLEEIDALTDKEVNEMLNPPGQLSDYATQKKIRYNTYSGIALTGISANFGKMMGYLFEAEDIASISNGKKVVEIGTDDFKELVGERKNLNEFLQNNTEWKINSRNIPTLKDSYHFTLDGEKIGEFVREERKIFAKQQPTNIFETIDTIINLAIDNVKEGKLHILGITNSNANAYLALVGMGLPLNAISRIFKTPIMKELNEGGRWVAKNINKYQLDPVLDKLFSHTEAELQDALEEYTGNPKLAKELISRAKSSHGSNEYLRGWAESLPIQTNKLDEIYTGKASTIIQELSDAAVLSTMKKLIPVGEQMFTYAQAFSLLRGMPSKKWKLDSIIDKIEGVVHFESEDVKKADILQKYTDSALNFFKENDAEYKRLLGVSEEQAAEYLENEFSKVKDSDILFGTPNAAARASYVNRLIRRRVDSSQKSSKNSVFKDNVITRLPHLMSAYRAAVELRTLMEKAFRMHAPAVRRLAERVVERANIFTPFDKLEKTDYVQKEIVKYLSSNLKFKLDGVDFSTEVPPSTETFYTANTSVTGAEAWAQRLIVEVSKLEIEGNEFLDSLEIVPNETTGLKSFRMLANKINDEEVVEQIRFDFGKLAESHPEVARNIFKYALLTEGMYYERTGLALVFPDAWAAEFSQAMEQRVDSIIPLADPITEYNLALLEDAFVYQFVRNNPSFVGYPREGRVKTQSETKNAKGYNERINAGEHDGISFDLEYPDTNYETMPKFVKYFSDDVYLRLNTPGKTSTYYVKVVEGANHSFYDFFPFELEQSLDLEKIANNSNRVISTAKINNSVYTGEESFLKDGQTVWALDKSAPLIKEAKVYKIKGEGVDTLIRGKKLYKYKLEYVNTVDLSKESSAVATRAQVSRFLPKQERLGNTLVIDDVERYTVIAKKQPFSRVLTTNANQLDGPIKLKTTGLPYDASTKEKEEFIKELYSQIESLDKNLTYFVDHEILNGLEEFPSMKRKVAELLNQKIGYRHAVLKENTTEKTTTLALDVLLAIKDTEVVTAFVDKHNLITATPEGPSTHLVPKKALFAAGWKKLRAGNIIKLDNATYGYVDVKTDTEALVTQFPASLMEYIEESEVSSSTFEKLILEKLSC